MEKTIKFGTIEQQERTIPINVIRQFPERPRQWANNRIIIVVTAGSHSSSAPAQPSAAV